MRSGCRIWESTPFATTISRGLQSVESLRSSAPAIKPIAVRCVFQVNCVLPYLPITGMGGIATADDAIEFILAGATAVAIGTANFYDPTVSEKIAQGIGLFLQQHGIQNLEAIRG